MHSVLRQETHTAGCQARRLHYKNLRPAPTTVIYGSADEDVLLEQQHWMGYDKQELEDSSDNAKLEADPGPQDDSDMVSESGQEELASGGNRRCGKNSNEYVVSETIKKSSFRRHLQVPRGRREKKYIISDLTG